MILFAPLLRQMQDRGAPKCFLLSSSKHEANANEKNL